MKILKITKSFFLSLFLIVAHTVSALTPNFNGTVGNFTTTLIGAGFGTANDLTASLQGKIDLVNSQTDGGTIVISGNVQLSQVKLKSNVYVNILKGTVIKVATTSKNPLFDLGVDATTNISNVKFYCGDCDNSKPVDDITQKYTVDVSNFAVGDGFRAFMLGNITNFWISDLYVIDNYTQFSCITLNPVILQTSSDNTIHKGLRDYSVIAAPTNGDVRNIYGINLHNGYGVVQTQCATNVCFEKLSGIGGVTLRMESGSEIQFVGTENGREFGVTQGIRASDLSLKNGFACVTLSPHGRINKDVYLENVKSESSCFGIHIATGFYDREVYDTTALGVKFIVDSVKFKKGYFTGPIIIKNVYSVYGVNAIGRKQEYDYVEKAIQSAYPWDNMSLYLADNSTRIIPSAASIGYLSLPNASSVYNRVEGEYNVTIDGPITSSGFNSILTTKYGNVLYEDDRSKIIGITSVEPPVKSIQNIDIYPIPAHDFVYINYPLNSKVLIFDLFGKMLKVFDTNSSGVSQVDVSSFSKGIYIVRVYNGNKDEKVKLIIN